MTPHNSDWPGLDSAARWGASSMARQPLATHTLVVGHWVSAAQFGSVSGQVPLAAHRRRAASLPGNRSVTTCQCNPSVTKLQIWHRMNFKLQGMINYCLEILLIYVYFFPSF